MYREYVQTLLGEKPIIAVEKVSKKEETVKPTVKSYQKNKIVQKLEIKIETNEIEKNNADITNIIEKGVDNDIKNHEIDTYCMLHDGALIIVDNVLWKGTVLGQVHYPASNELILHQINLFKYTVFLAVFCISFSPLYNAMNIQIYEYIYSKKSS